MRDGRIGLAVVAAVSHDRLGRDGLLPSRHSRHFPDSPRRPSLNAAVTHGLGAALPLRVAVDRHRPERVHGADVAGVIKIRAGDVGEPLPRRRRGIGTRRAAVAVVNLDPMMDNIVLTELSTGGPVVEWRRVEGVGDVVVVARLPGALHEQPGPFDELVHRHLGFRSRFPKQN